MLTLTGISKRYGAVEALKNVSFHVPKGGIVGLLGVNGAGKTTAIHIMTGYMPPDAGQVLIAGEDMAAHPRLCKRQIGYLPEKPPLYDEMTVREYLTFVARLREVQPAAIPAHVKEIEGLCGLSDMRDRCLGALSKGYRQRVGFAQALCGDPPLLILDEPTVGLDPRQVNELRALMRELGKTHTIIFSSHLLAEVQQLCQRVIILHHGEIVREDTLGGDSGAEASLRLQAQIAMDARRLLPALRGLPCVTRVQQHHMDEPGVTAVTLTCVPGTGTDRPEAQLFRLLTALDAPLLLLTPERETLEDIFLRVTAEN